MTLLKTYKLSLSLVLLTLMLTACASVERPDALICGVNSKAMKLRCYNIKDDFTNDGIRKPDAKAKDIPISSIHNLNGGIYASPSDFEKIKVWLADLRSYSERHCK